MYLQRSAGEENKWLFDRLAEERQELEGRFGAELRWMRLDAKKASRICYSHPFDGFDAEHWPEMIDWLCRHFVKLEEAFSKPLGRLGQELKSRGSDGASETDAAESGANA